MKAFFLGGAMATSVGALVLWGLGELQASFEFLLAAVLYLTLVNTINHFGGKRKSD